MTTNAQPHNAVKLTKSAVTVLYGLRNLYNRTKGDVDFDKCYRAYEMYIADIPKILNIHYDGTLEDIDELTKEVLDWLKSLPTKRVDTTLTGSEVDVVCGMLSQRITELHLEMEKLLSYAGLVEKVDVENGKSEST